MAKAGKKYVLCNIGSTQLKKAFLRLVFKKRILKFFVSSKVVVTTWFYECFQMPLVLTYSYKMTFLPGVESPKPQVLMYLLVRVQKDKSKMLKKEKKLFITPAKTLTTFTLFFLVKISAKIWTLKIHLGSISKGCLVLAGWHKACVSNVHKHNANLLTQELDLWTIKWTIHFSCG